MFTLFSLLLTVVVIVVIRRLYYPPSRRRPIDYVVAASIGVFLWLIIATTTLALTGGAS